MVTILILLQSRAARLLLFIKYTAAQLWLALSSRVSRVKLSSNHDCATCQPAAHRVETDSTCQSAANNAQHEGENLHQTAGLSPIKDNKHTATCTSVQHHNQPNNMNLGPQVMGHGRNHTMSRVMENHSHSVPRSLQLDSCLAQASSLCSRLNISPDIAYKTVREYSPSDADQSRGQGSTKQISIFETSTIRKTTATDSPTQLARVKIRQPARLAEEDRDTSALRFY